MVAIMFTGFVIGAMADWWRVAGSFDGMESVFFAGALPVLRRFWLWAFRIDPLSGAERAAPGRLASC
jgi:hypothetical protein